MRFSLFIVFLACLLPRLAHADIVEGERLARVHCASCHQFAAPELLPKRSWNFLLMYMGLRMGIEDFSALEGATDVEKEVMEARKSLVELEGAKPPAPMVTESQWESIREYYLATAPEQALPQKSKPNLEEGLPLFRSKRHSHYAQAAVTSMVHIDEELKQVLVGDSRYHKLTLLDSALRFKIDYPAKGTMWVRAKPTEEGIYLLSIGDIMGSFVEERRGRIFYGKRVGDIYLTRGVALTNLYRPSDMEFGDLDGDGVDEIVVSNFGPSTGSVAVHAYLGEGFTYDETPLYNLSDRPGAVDCAIRDFNGDGRLDVAALYGNAREFLSLYLNQGNGVFEEKVIIESNPAFGYVGFRWVDFDHDGDLDVFTINGDNIDADPYNTLKPYQGIRLYLNDGDLNFHEAFFYPMYGAYGLEVEDFDLDGDYDLAAISFNPDFDAKPLEGFAYLEQEERMRFNAKVHKATYKGRWLTMDAGDLDGDGDKDIVLGGAYVPAGLSVDKPELMNELGKTGEPILFLENQTR